MKETIDSETELVKRLIPIELNYDEEDNIWTLDGKDHGKYPFKASDDEIRKLLLKMEVKDSDSLPNSYRDLSYKKMITNSKIKGNYKMYMWKSKFPESLSSFNAMLKR